MTFTMPLLSTSSVDTFDHIFRNWLKSIANGLELLRMKNDIRYLSACQNLSENHDSLTSMLNENGIKKAYISADKENLYIVVLKICLFDTEFSTSHTDEKINAFLDIVEAVRQFCGKNGICARIKQNTFICLTKNNTDKNFLSDFLTSIIYQHTIYMKKYGMDSFVCTAEKCGNYCYDELLQICERNIQNEISGISERRCYKNYQILIAMRNNIYINPEATFDTDKLRENFDGSAGHLRNIYKKCFNIRFHQDCISARIAKAKFHLIIDNMNTQETAFQCGYSDNKYFMRQFVQITSLTANKFKRSLQQ